MHPLVAALKAKLPAEVQDSRRGLIVDEFMRVRGTRGTIFCLGDAAVTGPTPATALPPTAQVARQEGEYIAGLLSRSALAPVDAEAQGEGGEGGAAAEGADVVPLPADAKPFGYLHM